jgi:hypothetical protein
MKEKLLELIEKLEKTHDFEDRFYLTYTGQLNDGDISDWYNNHFDDNVELGFITGQTSMAEDIIVELKAIIEGEA